MLKSHRFQNNCDLDQLSNYQTAQRRPPLLVLPEKALMISPVTPHIVVSGKCYHMSSFSEAKAQDLIKNSAKDFVMYNSRQLSRIYPSGTRTGSSNYKPTPLWNVGCQIGMFS